jgi:HK97 family phage major capsid protein
MALKSLGSQFVDLADYKGIRTLTKKARLETDTFDIKAITNATGQNQPLVPDMRVPGVITTPNRRLRIRQLIPSGRTASNLVQYVKENVFTNNAGPQVGGSPTVAGENQTKNESDITFTLANAPVVTIAHFILVSTQVLEDAPMLESYINGRLLYGLALEEEEEILLADGSVGQLTGLMASATAFNRLATGTKLDILRRAITQLQLSEYDPEFYVLNPQDWEEIELLKDTTNQYVIANPQSMVGPTLWGLPVVVTNTMPRGQFLCANGTQAAQIWDRMQAAVELSREDSDNFRKNMVTILAEERLALAIYRASALIKGDYSNLNAS